MSREEEYTHLSAANNLREIKKSPDSQILNVRTKDICTYVMSRPRDVD